MAKYSRSARETISETMHEYGEGKLKSGAKSQRKVKSPRQALAIGHSRSRKKQEKVPGRSR